MAQLSMTIGSDVLGFHTHVEVIIPQQSADIPPAEKVLYLLHGLSDDCTVWSRMTRIYQYAKQNNYIVIMPEVQRSFYSDMAHGSKYFTYVTRELPETCERLLNLRHTRENTFVAGLSMGGYGAVKCGLSRPEFYTACASFSGAVDMKSRVEESKQMDPPPVPELAAILGEGLVYPDDADLFFLAEKAVKLPDKPRVLLTCGHKDFLIEDNRRFDAHMRALNYGHTYMEWPGEHTWDFWEDCLPLVFDFFEKRQGSVPQ